VYQTTGHAIALDGGSATTVTKNCLNRRETMQITETTTTLYKKVTTYAYTPTPAELYYWYSGTHAALSRDNPYAPKKSSMTKIQFKAAEGDKQ
jgi:hypothetical protein